MMTEDTGTLDNKVAQPIWVPATALTNGTGSAALESVDAIHNGLLFDGTSSETAGVDIVMPKYWKEVKLTWYSYNPTTGDGGVVFGAYVEDLVAGASLTAETPTIVSIGTTITCDGSEDNDDLVITESSNRYAVTPGGLTAFLFGRLPADAADTLAADYALLGVLITPTALDPS